MKVTKRNGNLEDFNLDKIHKILTWATDGIAGASVSDIEMNAQLNLYDKISTSEIHSVLIRSASSLISTDSPNYQYVASRLLLFQLRKQVWGDCEAPRLYDHIKLNVDKGIYDPNILDKYSESEIHKLGKYIKHNRDEKFTYSGLQQMVDKYLVKNRRTGEIYETPQFAYMLVPMILFADYPVETRFDYVKKAYDFISQFKINLPTPILAGVRTLIRHYSSCFTEDNLVWTDSGFKKIVDTDILLDRVLTHNGNNKQIVGKKESSFTGKLIGINTAFSFINEFECTSNHRILSISRNKINCKRLNSRACPTRIGIAKECFKKENRRSTDCPVLDTLSVTADWTEADSINVGDYIHIPHNKKIDGSSVLISEFITLPDNYVSSNGIIRKSTTDIRNRSGIYKSNINPIFDCNIIDERFFRLVGYFLAEGSFSSNYDCVQFTFNINETKWIEDVVNLSKELFGIDAKTYENREDNSTKVSLHSEVLGKLFFAACGQYSGGKFINQTLMNSEPSKQLEIIIGCARGDGYRDGNSGLSITLINRNLVYQLGQIALRNKLYPSLHKVVGEKIKKGEKTQPYTITFNKTKHHDLINTIGKFESTKSNKQIYSEGFWHNDEYYSVVSDKSEKYVENVKVYDIQVNTDHSFTVNGLSVHNCILIDVGDSLDSIASSNSAIFYYTSRRAGIGLNVGRIRPIGSEIRGGEVIHTGLLPYLKVFEKTCKSTTQNGIRGGGATVNIPFWHYEIEDVVVLKNNAGTDDNRVRQLDYCIHFSKLFYERLIKDEYITLFSPHECQELYDAFGLPEFDELYEECERKRNLKFKKKIKAKDFISLFTKERLETARIYIMNIDHVNQHGSWLDKVNMTNLCCVTGDTVVDAIISGLPCSVTIAELIECVNDGAACYVLSKGIDDNTIEYQLVTAGQLTRKDAELIEIEDEVTGKKLKCTPDHRIYTKNRGYVRADELLEDDELDII